MSNKNFSAQSISAQSNNNSSVNFANVALYFEEGWCAADGGDYESKENYVSFDKLFGANWQNQNQLIIDLYKLFKSEGETDDDLDKDYFQFYKSDGVDIYIANVDANLAKQIAQKMQFVNSKFNDKYVIHNLYIAYEDTEYEGCEYDDEFVLMTTEYVCTINKNECDK